MGRYILHYRGKDAPPDADLKHIRAVPGLKLIDQASARMLLVEAAGEALQKLQEMPSWTVTAETMTPLPDTRQKIKRNAV